MGRLRNSTWQGTQNVPCHGTRTVLVDFPPSSRAARRASRGKRLFRTGLPIVHSCGPHCTRTNKAEIAGFKSLQPFKSSTPGGAWLDPATCRQPLYFRESRTKLGQHADCIHPKKSGPEMSVHKGPLRPLLLVGQHTRSTHGKAAISRRDHGA